MNQFKASNGTRLLRALFYETTPIDKAGVLYTLKDVDHKGYPSLYRLYMKLDDLTEYEFSQMYMDGWEHWTMLCECPWFKDVVTRWRKELLLRTQANCLRAIRLEASEGKNQYHANKYLLEAGWQEPDTKKRGRPSKEDIKKEAEAQASNVVRLREDFKRISTNAQKAN